MIQNVKLIGIETIDNCPPTIYHIAKIMMMVICESEVTANK